MTCKDARPRGREAGLTKVKPGLSQNSLIHSFMSASFFLKSDLEGVSREETLVCGWKARSAGISKKQPERAAASVQQEKLG